MSFIIQDWAGNVLNFEGRFQSVSLSVPMEFESFEDAWGWIYDSLDDMSDEELETELGEFDVIPKPARNFGLKGN